MSMAENRPRPACLSLVVAVAANGVIGRNNDLPWRIPGDLKWFKRQTVGRPIIMGRRTFQSIGGALPKRRNIVLTRNGDWSAPDVECAPDLVSALELVAGEPEAAVIGGADVFAEALPLADKLVWTAVYAAPEGDTVMPAIEWTQWRETFREAHAAEGDAPAHDFVIYDRLPGK